MSSLLDIKNLSVEFSTDQGIVHALTDASLQIKKGTTMGLVGESGSGKSVTSLCTMGLLPTPPGRITQGQIVFEGENLLDYSESQWRKIRGNRISMIFQEPMTSLNPVFTVGYQIVEAIQLHQKLNKKEAWEKAEVLLDKVGIQNAQQRIKAYPHEMSGGQRQRVMIAMAIACEPDLLIADEPTTALDVTIQKQILELIAQLQSESGMSVLFITHDLAVIGDIADEVTVMYRGQVVEKGKKESIFQNPQHPYTKGLIACRPKLTDNFSRLPTVRDFMTEEGKSKTFDIKILGERSVKPASSSEPLLEVKNLKKYFSLKGGFFNSHKGWIRAVDDVSFKVFKGQTLGLVGESGCGKTTLGRTILRLTEPTEGQISFAGKDITAMDRSSLRQMRRRMQIIFQDPYASLNPRMSIGAAIVEPMIIHHLGETKKQRWEMASELLERVGLESFHLDRYPHEFSGGQRQRICIARALAVQPEFIICDESVSSLDVSIQAQILNLLMDLQEDLNLTYIFISHDLAVVKFISDNLAVMNQGKIVEFSDSQEVYKNPKDKYTRQLLDSIPKGL